MKMKVIVFNDFIILSDLYDKDQNCPSTKISFSTNPKVNFGHWYVSLP